MVNLVNSVECIWDVSEKNKGLFVFSYIHCWLRKRKISVSVGTDIVWRREYKRRGRESIWASAVKNVLVHILNTKGRHPRPALIPATAVTTRRATSPPATVLHDLPSGLYLWECNGVYTPQSTFDQCRARTRISFSPSILRQIIPIINHFNNLLESS